jgi:GT2 family glycosyltransferase
VSEPLFINTARFPLVSIIVLNFNGMDVLLTCLVSVLGSNYPNFELILVDNASTDGSVEEAEKLFHSDSRVKIVRNDRNLGYAEGNNVGINDARGEIIVFLNNDTKVDANWLTEMMRVFKDDLLVGAAQPKILNYDYPEKIDSLGGSINFYGFAIAIGGNLGINDFACSGMREIFFAVGSAMVVRRKLLNEVGFFDPSYFMFGEDVDLSWRIRLRGYKILLIPRAIVYHKISFTVTKTPNIKIIWHLRKNRVVTLIKNYELKNLMKAFPVIVFICVANLLREIAQKDMKKAFTNISSLVYSLKNLKQIWYERIIVQRKIRRVSDDEILKLVSFQLPRQ